MGIDINTTVPGSFENVLMRSLASTQHVFLFDQPALVKEIAGYHSVYYELCSRSGRAFYELEASQVTEQGLVDSLVHSAPETTANTRSNSAHSNYRVLTDRIDRTPSGLICIHNGQDLSTHGIHILSRLRNHVRRNKLGWQILIFAKTAELSNLALLQLSVDTAYPQSVADVRWMDNRKTKLSPAIDLLPIYALRTAIGVSVFLLALFLSWKTGWIL